MQIMVHKQHFGKLAIGLSNVDEGRARHLTFLSEEHEIDRERFYTITSGGISHPWAPKKYEVRVAITGDCMVFDEYELQGDAGARIFAKVEFTNGNEVYLAYSSPWSVIGYGFPDPIKSANEIVEMAAAGFYKTRTKEGCRWMVVDKRQVPKYHRSLLGKVMNRVDDAFTQGDEFFRDLKAR